MGAHAWFYFVPYDEDVSNSLEALQRREFWAGRYNPCEPFPRFPVDLNHAPGAKHRSIDAARTAADADGTRSILDITRVSAKPDFGAVAPLDDDELMDYFGSTKPTAMDVESSDALFEEIERGQGVYVVVYENDAPSQLFFAGYSYD
jgi:hypothetical protein